MNTQELPGCKCQVVFWESGGFRMVSQCPLHRHAKDLLAACELLVLRLEHLSPYLEYQSVQRCRNASAIAVAESAIARAKREGDA